MRVEGSVTSVSWIPSESVTGSVYRVPFEVGFAHYDAPPPDQLDDVRALLARDGARFVNELNAWIEVEDGRVVGHDHAGAGHIGSTTVRVGPKDVTFQAVALPDRRRVQQLGDEAVRFEQTAGGRTGVPAPRRVSHPPYVQYFAPTAWTTLALTLHADGRQEFELVGASPFPRHWVYDHDGRLASKSATIDYPRWSSEAFGRHTPWGDTDSPAFVSAVESALERELSRTIMRSGTSHTVRRVSEGQRLVTQGDRAEELFLLLDGVLAVDVDGDTVAEVGPGAVLGERAALESGTRTATLTAVTPCTVAVAPREVIAVDALQELSEGHRREDTRTGEGQGL